MPKPTIIHHRSFPTPPKHVYTSPIPSILLFVCVLSPPLPLHSPLTSQKAKKQTKNREGHHKIIENYTDYFTTLNKTKKMPLSYNFTRFLEDITYSLFIDTKTNSSSLGYITYSSQFESDSVKNMIAKVDDFCQEISSEFGNQIIAKMTGAFFLASFLFSLANAENVFLR